MHFISNEVIDAYMKDNGLYAGFENYKANLKKIKDIKVFNGKEYAKKALLFFQKYIPEIQKRFPEFIFSTDAMHNGINDGAWIIYAVIGYDFREIFSYIPNDYDNDESIIGVLTVKFWNSIKILNNSNRDIECLYDGTVKDDFKINEESKNQTVIFMTAINKLEEFMNNFEKTKKSLKNWAN